MAKREGEMKRIFLCAGERLGSIYPLMNSYWIPKLLRMDPVDTQTYSFPTFHLPSKEQRSPESHGIGEAVKNVLLSLKKKPKPKGRTYQKLRLSGETWQFSLTASFLPVILLHSRTLRLVRLLILYFIFLSLYLVSISLLYTHDHFTGIDREPTRSWNPCEENVSGFRAD